MHSGSCSPPNGYTTQSAQYSPRHRPQTSTATSNWWLSHRPCIAGPIGPNGTNGAPDIDRSPASGPALPGRPTAAGALRRLASYSFGLPRPAAGPLPFPFAPIPFPSPSPFPFGTLPPCRPGAGLVATVGGVVDGGAGAAGGLAGGAAGASIVAGASAGAGVGTGAAPGPIDGPAAGSDSNGATGAGALDGPTATGVVVVDDVAAVVLVDGTVVAAPADLVGASLSSWPIRSAAGTSRSHQGRRRWSRRSRSRAKRRSSSFHLTHGTIRHAW